MCCPIYNGKLLFKEASCRLGEVHVLNSTSMFMCDARARTRHLSNVNSTRASWKCVLFQPQGCFRQRKRGKNMKGQGQQFGSLAAWLRFKPDPDDAGKHKEKKKFFRVDRQGARKWLKGFSQGRKLLKTELEKDPRSSDSEPRKVP